LGRDMKRDEWKPLSPRYLDPEGRYAPRTLGEAAEDGLRGLGWLSKTLFKGLLWAGVIAGALLLLFTGPVGFVIEGFVVAVVLYLLLRGRSC